MKKFEPKNQCQKNLIRSIAENDITLCIGPPGTGKTLVSVGMSLEYLFRKDNNIHKIVLVRPIQEVGRGLGFMPGTHDEKSKEYSRPLLNKLEYFIGKQEVDKFIKDGRIQLLPICSLRGESFENSFVIGDDSQNFTYDQTKCLLTRIGENSKMLLNGDPDQSDLPNDNKDYIYIVKKLQNIIGIGVVEFSQDNIVRHRLIKEILNRI